jgi:hypothetical protein
MEARRWAAQRHSSMPWIGPLEQRLTFPPSAGPSLSIANSGDGEGNSLLFSNKSPRTGCGSLLCPASCIGGMEKEGPRQREDEAQFGLGN